MLYDVLDISNDYQGAQHLSSVVPPSSKISGPVDQNIPPLTNPSGLLTLGGFFSNATNVTRNALVKAT